MSNFYTNTCFAFTVTAAEAALIRQSLAFCTAICDEDDDTIADLWRKQPAEFRSIYPDTTATPASGFLAIFDEPKFPSFDVELEYTDNPEGTTTVTGQSSEFSPTSVAAMLARCVTSSLPIAITWSDDADKYRPGNFGGGGFHINAAGVHWISPYDVNHADRFTPRFVLSISDPRKGLVFWNEGNGFGDLANATILSDEQRRCLTLPPALDHPRWLQLPEAHRS